MDLFQLIRENNVPLFKNEILNGANIHCKSNKGRSLLQSAIDQNNIEIVNFLLENGIDSNGLIMKDMSYLQYVYFIGDKEAGFLYLTTDIQCYKFQRLQILKSLLVHGADVNRKNKMGDTILHNASFSGYTEIVRSLIQYGADVNIKSNDGSTALEIAKKRNHVGVMNVINQHIICKIRKELWNCWDLE